VQEITMTEGVLDYYGVFAKAFIEALGKHAAHDAAMSLAATRPLAAYWSRPRSTADQLLRRVGSP
jgi:hypothetical protein